MDNGWVCPQCGNYNTKGRFCSRCRLERGTWSQQPKDPKQKRSLMELILIPIVILCLSIGGFLGYQFMVNDKTPLLVVKSIFDISDEDAAAKKFNSSTPTPKSSTDPTPAPSPAPNPTPQAPEPAPKPSPSTLGKWGTVNADAVNVRTAATSNSQVANNVSRGTRVQILAEEISGASNKGVMAQEYYAKPDGAGGGTDIHLNNGVAVTVIAEKNGMLVCDYPGRKYSYALIDPAVVKREAGQVWYKIKFVNGSIGYMFSDFIDVDK